MEVYSINPEKTIIPDVELGNFIEGFASEQTPFDKSRLLWNLLPIVGQILFCIFLLIHVLKKTRVKRLFFYEKGFMIQYVGLKGKIQFNQVFNYSDIMGIAVERTKQYSNIYGYVSYTGTLAKVSVIENDGSGYNELLLGIYKSEDENPTEYNFIGHACSSIIRHWTPIAMKRLNDELVTKGYITFRTGKNVVIVNRDYIKIDDRVISRPFSYSFENGMLYLYPEYEDNAYFRKTTKPEKISVSGMFNKEVFFTVLDKFFAIR